MKIQLIRLATNEIVIAEVKEETEEYLWLKDPVSLVPTKEGSLSFVPWSPLSEKDALVKTYIRNVVYLTTPNEEVIKNYNDIFSTIITPQNSGKIIV